MTSTALNYPERNSTGSLPRLVLLASVALNVAIAFGALTLCVTIFNLEDFGRLGLFVQRFVALAVLIPAALAVYSSVQIVRRKASGRFAALVLQYVGFVLSVVALLHLWGFFLSFEQFVDTIMANATLTLGFALAYAVFFAASRLDENTRARGMLENAAYIIGMITLVMLLLSSNVLGAANHILSTYAQPATWFATIAAVLLGATAYLLLKQGDYYGETPAENEAWQGWLMLSPNILGFTIFFAGPLLLSFYLSFTNATLNATPEFNNLENYRDLLSLEAVWNDNPEEVRAQSLMSFGYTPLIEIPLSGRVLVIGAQDTEFWYSLRNTTVFCLLLLPLSVLPALGLSLVLNSKLPGVKFYRAVYFLPSVAAVVGTAIIWRWLYDPTIGFFNHIISQVVLFLNNTVNLNIADPSIPWLTGPSVVLISVVFLAAWQVVGFNTVLFMAGLQGIPRELYEAATVDGAGGWGQFRWVTLPMLAPTTFFVIITTVVTGLQVFNEPYALFPSIPIPIEARTAVYYLYYQGFKNFSYGYSSAVAWLLFAVIFLITLLQFRLSRSNAYEG